MMLSFKEIDKTFNKGTSTESSLYKDLNLDINNGEFITIIGSNGSGKSTLLNLICGQVKPDNGLIKFDSENLLKTKGFHRFKRISRVYQDPLAGTSPSLTVIENLALASGKGKLFNLRKLSAKNERSKFIEILASLDMNLEDKLDVKVAQLSGGQRQGLSLLMALMNEPDVLLLDEHTAALDPKSSEAIMALTNKMIQERKITTIMVTHNLNHALEYGTRLLMFHEGKIIHDVKAEEKKKLDREKLINMFVEYEDSFAETL